MVACNNDIITGKGSYPGPLANLWLPLTARLTFLMTDRDRKLSFNHFCFAVQRQ